MQNAVDAVEDLRYVGSRREMNIGSVVPYPFHDQHVRHGHDVVACRGACRLNILNDLLHLLIDGVLEKIIGLFHCIIVSVPVDDIDLRLFFCDARYRIDGLYVARFCYADAHLPVFQVKGDELILFRDIFRNKPQSVL